MRDKRTQSSPTNVTVDSVKPHPLHLMDPDLRALLRMITADVSRHFEGATMVPEPSYLMAWCDTHLTRDRFAKMALTEDMLASLRDDLRGYVRLLFSQKSTSICTVLGYVVSVDSLLYPPATAKYLTVEDFIQEIDDQLTALLPLPQELYSVTLGRLVVAADVSKVDPKDHPQLVTALVTYVTMRQNPAEGGTISIEGKHYFVSPLLTQKPTPNIDAMRRSQEINQTREMFRPYLIRSIYSYLVGKAFLGHTTTYENIANEFGLPNKGNQLGSTLSPLLADIYHFCERNHQPHLTAIVVRKSGEDKDLPGKGFWDLYNGEDDRREWRAMTKTLQAEVFAYWGSLGQ